MKWQKLLMFSMLAVPLSESKEWTQLSFSKITPHKVEFLDKKMLIKVNNSAMPLIYKLKEPVTVKSLRVKGRVSHMLELKPNQIQGDFKTDDFILKIGLVKPGDKTMNWIQKKLAAEWVVSLYELAPKNTGISGVEFYNIVQQKALLGKKRQHPQGKGLISENYQWFMKNPGEFDFSVKFDEPTKVLALWLSPDGDNTQSKYELQIMQIQLN